MQIMWHWHDTAKMLHCKMLEKVYADYEALYSAMHIKHNADMAVLD